MRTNESRIARLESANRLLLCLIALSVLGLAANNYLNSLRADLRNLSVFWLLDGEIRFSSSSDGPFVVTHLVRDGDNEGAKAVARLAQPLAIIDSRGAILSKNQISRLNWFNIYGQPVAAPKAGTNIKALYFRPEITVRK